MIVTKIGSSLCGLNCPCSLLLLLLNEHKEMLLDPFTPLFRRMIARPI